MVGRAVHQLLRDSATLIDGIDGDDLDDAHSLVERVECDSGEAHGLAIRNRNEDVPLIGGASGTDGLRLNRCPVRLVKTLEDRVAQNPPKRLEHRLPRPQRKLNDLFQIRPSYGRFSTLALTACNLRRSNTGDDHGGRDRRRADEMASNRPTSTPGRWRLIVPNETHLGFMVPPPTAWMPWVQVHR